METNRPYKIYSRNDLKRYLNGEMSSSEMYALEKQAIEDPFLQDAIEGYNSITNDAANADIAWLEQQLTQNEEAKVIELKKKNPASNFSWAKLGIAASVVGVLFFVGAQLLNRKTKDEPSIVQHKNEVNAIPNNNNQKQIDSSNEQMTSEQPNEKSTNVAINPETTVKENKKVYVKPEDLTAYYEVKDKNIPIHDVKPAYTIEEKVIAGNNASKWKLDSLPVKPLERAKDEIVATEPTVAENKESPTLIEAKPTSVFNNVASNRNGNEIVFDKRAQQNNNRSSNTNDFAKQKTDAEADNLNFSRSYKFNYTIVDENGNSIPFTNISVPADQLVTYSRVDGKFGLFSSDSVLNVNFRAAGYVPQNMQLTNNTNGKIVLQSANANMNEVVVTSASKSLTKKSGKLQSVIEEAEPIDGVSNYDHYIANNINTIQKPQGEVVLSFDVGENGEPTNIVVNKSLSATADQEAIRLLTQGPKWKSIKKKSKKGKIVIKF